jgi:hypothetical protein
MSATTTAITIETVQDKVLTLTMSTTETATAAVTVLKSCHVQFLPLKQGRQLSHNMLVHRKIIVYRERERERDREREHGEIKYQPDLPLRWFTRFHCTIFY